MRMFNILITFVLFCFAVCSLELAAAQELRAFSYLHAPSKADRLNSKSNFDASAGGWQIELNRSVLNVKAGDVVILELPSSEELPVLIRSVKRDRRGVKSIFGKFGDEGSLVLTASEGTVYGSMSSATSHYSISQMNDGTLRLFDAQATGSYNLESDYLLPPRKKQQEMQSKQRLDKLSEVSEKTQGVSQVDFLAVYSSVFATVFPNPEIKIQQLLNFTNDSLANSGVLIEFRLVAARQLNFDNNASLSANLNAATFATGSFAGLPELRDAVGADMVGVLHGSNGNSAAGIAWVNGDSDRFAFSSTRLSPVCCESVFAHEIGHNLGSGHEHAAVNPNANDPCSGFFLSYACGHGASDRSWGTVMSRLNDSAIGFRFSNLDFTCQGERCGVPEGQPNPADNRRAFNMSRLLIKDFRLATDSCLGLNPSSACWLPPINSLLLDD